MHGLWLGEEESSECGPHEGCILGGGPAAVAAQAHHRPRPSDHPDQVGHSIGGETCGEHAVGGQRPGEGAKVGQSVCIAERSIAAISGSTAAAWEATVNRRRRSMIAEVEATKPRWAVEWEHPGRPSSGGVAQCHRS